MYSVVMLNQNAFNYKTKPFGNHL